MAALPPPPPGVSVPPTPNQTLYVRHLPDKLQKLDLQRSLYMLFATYGIILDIVALKTPKMRGQAHVVFRDVDASTQAMRALDGFEFFGKKMSISYAKGKSNIINKMKGIMPGSEAAAGDKPGQTNSATTVGFGAAPAKAVPINEAARAGVKRAHEDDDEAARKRQNSTPGDESEEDADMEISSDEDD